MKLIIFDFDGTLADTQGYIVATMHKTMCKLGLPLRPAEACAATIGLPLKGCFQQLYPGISDAEAELYMSTYRHIFDENRDESSVDLFPGVKETLGWLKEKGYLLSIASSRTTRTMVKMLEEKDLVSPFSLFIGVTEVQNAKPHPEPVLKTLEALEVPASEALVVGDMPVDILMGSRAGARTCGVTYGNSTRPELLEAGADYIIDSFSELKTIL
jgi:phosphoglycolate phosphatase